MIWFYSNGEECPARVSRPVKAYIGGIFNRLNITCFTQLLKRESALEFACDMVKGDFNRNMFK